MGRKLEIGEVVDLTGDNGEIAQLLRNYGVGIDTHKKFIAVCVNVKNGNDIRRYEKEFPTSWGQLKQAKEWIESTIKTKSDPVINPEPLYYTIESTGTYHNPVLKALEGSPSVVNPLLASPSRRKTDKLDARLLAYQSMTGLWPTSFIVSEEVTQLRLLCRQREYHLRTATKISNQINNYILRFGHTIGAVGSVSKNMMNRALIEDMCSDHFSYFTDANILSTNFICPEGLPEIAKGVFPAMYEEYDLHIEKSKAFEKKALAYAKSLKWETKKGFIGGDELLEYLCSVPGVGELTSLLWLTEVVTPFRFQSAKQIGAYCGCDPSLKVSAGKVTSQTRRKGNATLHHAIIRSAGTCVQKHSEPFGQWGFNMYNRVGSWKKACGAVGRRIVVAMYYVHRNAEIFSYDKYRFYDVKVKDIPLEQMDISNRVKTILSAANFTVSSEVADAYVKGELAKLKGFGAKATAEIDIWVNKNRKGVVKNG